MSCDNSDVSRSWRDNRDPSSESQRKSVTLIFEYLIEFSHRTKITYHTVTTTMTIMTIMKGVATIFLAPLVIEIRVVLWVEPVLKQSSRVT